MFEKSSLLCTVDSAYWRGLYARSMCHFYSGSSLSFGATFIVQTGRGKQSVTSSLPPCKTRIWVTSVKSADELQNDYFLPRGCHISREEASSPSLQVTKDVFFRQIDSTRKSWVYEDTYDIQNEFYWKSCGTINWRPTLQQALSVHFARTILPACYKAAWNCINGEGTYRNVGGTRIAFRKLSTSPHPSQHGVDNFCLLHGFKSGQLSKKRQQECAVGRVGHQLSLSKSAAAKVDFLRSIFSWHADDKSFLTIPGGWNGSTVLEIMWWLCAEPIRSLIETRPTDGSFMV